MTRPVITSGKLIGLDNNWTGGQYSIYRGLLGLYLGIYFLNLVLSNGELKLAFEPSDLSVILANVLSTSERIPINIIVFAIASIISIGLSLGAYDRWISSILIIILMCVPSTLGPHALTTPLLIWLLILNLGIPQPAYGSVRARNRVDPRGNFRFPRIHFQAAWIVLATAYMYIGLSALSAISSQEVFGNFSILENLFPNSYPNNGKDFEPLDATAMTISFLDVFIGLIFAPLAIFKSCRPKLWGSLVVLGLFKLFLEPNPSGVVMLLAHASVFDPGWLPGQGGPYRLFYDGTCGLCHRSVRFILSEQIGTPRIYFSTLQSKNFQKLPTAVRDRVPDSLVLVTNKEPFEVKCQSEAVISILKSLGGFWKFLGWGLSYFPRVLRDGVYNFLASHRRYLFAEPAESCPVIPDWAKTRFD